MSSVSVGRIMYCRRHRRREQSTTSLLKLLVNHGTGNLKRKERKGTEKQNSNASFPSFNLSIVYLMDFLRVQPILISRNESKMTRRTKNNHRLLLDVDNVKSSSLVSFFYFHLFYQMFLVLVFSYFGTTGDFT